MPLIAIEGVDGSGKSTLADMLARWYDGRVVHLGPPASPDTAVDECIDPIVSYDQHDPDDLLIFDRAHWGCPVYGPIYRPDVDRDGYGDMGQAGWRYVELFFYSRGGITVLVDADPHVARQRCIDRGEDYIDLDHIEHLVNRYRSLYLESLTGAIQRQLNTEADTQQLALDTIRLARIHRKKHERFADYHYYVGSELPSVLIVCRPDRKRRIEALEAASKWTNWEAVGFGSTAASIDSLESLWLSLGQPKVVGEDNMPAAHEEWVADKNVLEI